MSTPALASASLPNVVAAAPVQAAAVNNAAPAPGVISKVVNYVWSRNQVAAQPDAAPPAPPAPAALNSDKVTVFKEEAPQSPTTQQITADAINSMINFNEWLSTNQEATNQADQKHTKLLFNLERLQEALAQDDHLRTQLLAQAQAAEAAKAEMAAKLEAAVAAAKAANHPDNIAFVRKPIIQEATDEVKALATHIADFQALVEKTEKYVNDFVKNPDTDAEYKGLKEAIKQCTEQYNAKVALFQEQHPKITTFYNIVCEAIAASKTHMGDQSIDTAASHLRMSVGDYKSKVIEPHKEALIAHKALKHETQTNVNTLVDLTEKASTHIATLETGLTNKGAPNARKTVGLGLLKAATSENAKPLPQSLKIA